jgi:urease accessory protein
MGASTNRITAAEFVTPPEFRSWPLAGNPAGRVGGVRLELAAHAGQTRLVGSYQQVPLRVLPPFQSGPDEPALLYLLNPTAGLLDGDAQLVCIEVGAGTRTVVTGQSATRIHPCLVSHSTQQWRIHVAAGAVLVVLPGPAIPFAGCRYYQRAEIDLEKGAGLVWADIWLAGRYARGKVSEQFQFETIIQELRVRRAGQLVYRDRFCWRGPWDADTAEWHFGGAPACGSVFVTGPLSAACCTQAGAGGGSFFPTGAGDTCLRWCGSSEDVTAGVVGSALSAGASLGGEPESKPWLLSGHGLAPNHWFRGYSLANLLDLGP